MRQNLAPRAVFRLAGPVMRDPARVVSGEGAIQPSRCRAGENAAPTAWARRASVCRAAWPGPREGEAGPAAAPISVLHWQCRHRDGAYARVLYMALLG